MTWSSSPCRRRLLATGVRVPLAGAVAFALAFGPRLATPAAAQTAAGQTAAAPTADADDVVMIVHKDNPHPVDRVFVQRIYTGALRGWPDGSPVFALDYTEDVPVRQRFLQTVVGRSAASLKAIWSQNIFTGKGYPPRQMQPGAEMKRLVAANRNALGYIRAGDADDTVRVIRP